MSTRLLAQSRPLQARVMRITTSTTSANLLSSASHRSGALGSSLGSDSSMIAANDRMLFHKDSNVATDHRYFSTAAAADTDADADAGAMQDEYGEMTSDGHTYVHPAPLVLESGQVLQDAQLRYQTFGDLNEARDNVIVVCHALTGNASLDAWWGDMLGPGKAFDTNRYFIVCSNILGSCYGSTNPTSINPETGIPYGKDFPDISVKDTVKLQLHMLVNALQVNSIKAVIGGSFGGMQAMEFAVQAGSSYTSPYAEDCFFTKDSTPLVRSVIPIACGAAHTAWQIAISETQRQAIYADPNWETNPTQATTGLAVARQIGMVSYRTPKGYCTKFGRGKQVESSPDYGSNAKWKVKSYLEYQGDKFLSRFDPVTYVKMTEQMDSHDVARGRGPSLEAVLENVEIPALVLGIDSDVLYPLQEQQELASLLPNSRLHIVHSDDGHDGFLLEQEQVAAHIIQFLKDNV